eukprot:CAMPEP_0197643542 /NCGR_PEP_ID=MMETSP1338-20131121/16826_1 /TAXON_ID=43686 ORGANISM="Pelagodinium beii, Strain RCC1491" /NCGR_SAMPLE_ID=MMETSP1338 /ASSEMBLY_ACC=CAM_ASM_000754 /LENGTH=93 /DNA_ID=CAMNT_0043216807 /DNA_START=360 /DNA_END=637 /DNA_ORIENTATION=-
MHPAAWWQSWLVAYCLVRCRDRRVGYVQLKLAVNRFENLRSFYENAGLGPAIVFLPQPCTEAIAVIEDVLCMLSPRSAWQLHLKAFLRATGHT